MTELADKTKAMRAILQQPEYSAYLSDKHTDFYLHKMLRARKGNVNDAVKLWKEVQIWRRDNNIDTILDTFRFVNQEATRKYYFKRFHKCDKLGRPVLYTDFGRVDYQKLWAAITPQDLLQEIIYENEKLERFRYAACCKKYNTNIDQYVSILDCKNISFSNVKETYNWLNVVSPVAERYFPER
jgi:hypothetical protein